MAHEDRSYRDGAESPASLGIPCTGCRFAAGDIDIGGTKIRGAKLGYCRQYEGSKPYGVLWGGSPCRKFSAGSR